MIQQDVGYLEHQPRVDFVVQLVVLLEEGVDYSKAADLCTCWTWKFQRYKM